MREAKTGAMQRLIFSFQSNNNSDWFVKKNFKHHSRLCNFCDNITGTFQDLRTKAPFRSYSRFCNSDSNLWYSIFIHCRACCTNYRTNKRPENKLCSRLSYCGFCNIFTFQIRRQSLDTTSRHFYFRPCFDLRRTIL